MMINQVFYRLTNDGKFYEMQKTKGPKINLDRVILLILSVLMIGVSAYLSLHYYEVHYPTQMIIKSALCQINDFWNCDSVSFSAMAQIFGIPTAIFGVLMGAIFLCSAATERRDIDTTNYFLALINALGCVGLFIYSLTQLHALCPGCVLYYILSIAVLIRYALRMRRLPLPNLRILALYGALLFACILTMKWLTKDLAQNDEKLVEKLISEVNQWQTVDEGLYTSDFNLTPIDDHPKNLRITLISDFLCPFCAIFASEIMPLIIKRYEPNIQVTYWFYPLDMTCNPNLGGSPHPMACEAAYLAYCAKTDFAKVHDDIYAHAHMITPEWLSNKASSMHASQCYADPATKEALIQITQKAKDLQIKGTPTLIINGKVLHGILPIKYLFAIFDNLIANKNH